MYRGLPATRMTDCIIPKSHVIRVNTSDVSMNKYFIPFGRSLAKNAPYARARMKGRGCVYSYTIVLGYTVLHPLDR